MYKRLFIGTIATLALVILLLVAILPAMADPGETAYIIRVRDNGQPVPNAYVRLAGIGVEMTDLNGVAVFPLNLKIHKAEKIRGDLYAASKGRMPGLVIDEYDILKVYVSSHDIGEKPRATCLYCGGIWNTDQLIKGECPNITPINPDDPGSGDDAHLHTLQYEPSFALGTEIWIMPGILYELDI